MDLRKEPTGVEGDEPRREPTREFASFSESSEMRGQEAGGSKGVRGASA